MPLKRDIELGKEFVYRDKSGKPLVRIRVVGIRHDIAELVIEQIEPDKPPLTFDDSPVHTNR